LATSLRLLLLIVIANPLSTVALTSMKGFTTVEYFYRR
jgi:hypothetical protein